MYLNFDQKKNILYYILLIYFFFGQNLGTPENQKCRKTKEKAGLWHLAFKEVSGHTLALMDTP